MYWNCIREIITDNASFELGAADDDIYGFIFKPTKSMSKKEQEITTQNVDLGPLKVFFLARLLLLQDDAKISEV